jgi:hypothetical protein
METCWEGETEVLEDKVLQCQFVHQDLELKA